MKKIIILTGPTASGKSKIAENLHNLHSKGISIINADSKQVYKQIPILTSQPLTTKNYKLYGYIDVNQCYSVAIWLQDIEKTIEQAIVAEKIPLVVGGSGMYISTLINGLSYSDGISKFNKKTFIDKHCNKSTEILYKKLSTIDPAAAAKIHPNDTYRIQHALFVKTTIGQSITSINQHRKQPNSSWMFKIYSTMPSREKLYHNIDQRVLKFFDIGVIKEVHNLLSTNISNEAKQSIGFQEIKKYLEKKISIDNAIALMQQKTRNYAKRQITWIKNQLTNAEIVENANMIDIK
ncbi:tRNA dimethylallyltransferase [Candidatus Xenohaliotis californiensis]|uniref:tRNA dimethylallyltransferase n=1 Tax=Candidatus Xenohaliotis californiensis TaxID=84677 RepID=A0ABP0ERS6_9RICK|nr:tRNA dimethylallyltransferase [Candidatus Xenohaliotis californiensis]